MNHKEFFTYVFIYFLIISTFPVSSAFSGSGAGTSGDPYQITNWDELNETRDDLNAYYDLMNNLNSSTTGFSNYNSSEGFEPITIFEGSFDGQNYTIDSLFINRPTENEVGLFGKVYEADFDNIYLTNVNITGKDFVGGLIGNNYIFYTSNIDNSYVTGTITGEDYVGGLVGQLGYNSQIDDSHTSGTVNGINSVGGLVGYQYESGIDNSYSTMDVNGSVNVGGITGYSGWGAGIDNSYSTGSVTGINIVGGIIGKLQFSVVDNSYSTGNVNGTNNIGGLAGLVTGQGIVRDSYSSGNVNGSDNIGGLVGRIDQDSSIINSYSTGNVSGTGDIGGFIGYLTSSTITNSYWYNRSQGLDCYSGGNTGCSSINAESYFYNYSKSPMNVWDFSNSWDFKISEFTYLPHLLFESSLWHPYLITDWVGLNNARENMAGDYTLLNDLNSSTTGFANYQTGLGFESIGNNSVSFTGSFNGQNNTIDSLYINRPTESYLGLFGYVNTANINNTYMTNSYIRGGNIAGSLAGYSYDSNIDNCYSADAYLDGLISTGGLVGFFYNSDIDNSYVTGNVSGTSYAGGLFGSIEHSSVFNSYANVNMNGSVYIGGIAGRAYYVDIDNSYATGNVSGAVSVGGLFGTPSYSTIDNSFYNGEVYGTNQIGGLIGEMGYNVIINNTYSIGNVTATGNSIGGLIGKAEAYAGSVYNSYSTMNVTSSGDYVGGLIGYSYYGNYDNCYATGNVTGKAHVGGLIGKAYKDVSVDNSYATGDIDGGFSGGLIGHAYYNVDIDNSYATGNVVHSGPYDGTGGLVGWAGYVDINKSYATGNVSGDGYDGGLVGYTYYTNIDNSYATGNVYPRGPSAGGLVGSLTKSNINTSYATGDIVSPSISIGGLVGNTYYASVDNSYATGNVSGVSYVGGLIGNRYLYTTMDNNYWLNKSQGLDCYSGGNTDCTAVETESYFYNYSNSPMSLWEFSSTWDNILNLFSYPVLQFQDGVLVDFVNQTTSTGNYSRNYIEANVSAYGLSEDLDTLTISFYNSSGINNQTLVNSSNSSINQFLNYTGLADGTYYLNATANDTSGNIVSTTTRTIFIDATLPILNININEEYQFGKRIEQEYISVGLVYTSFDINSIVSSWSLLRPNGSTTEQSGLGATETAGLKLYEYGYYIFTVNVSDGLNNVSKSVSFSVQKTTSATSGVADDDEDEIILIIEDDDNIDLEELKEIVIDAIDIFESSFKKWSLYIFGKIKSYSIIIFIFILFLIVSKKKRKGSKKYPLIVKETRSSKSGKR